MKRYALAMRSQSQSAFCARAEEVVAHGLLTLEDIIKSDWLSNVAKNTPRLTTQVLNERLRSPIFCESEMRNNYLSQKRSIRTRRRTTT